MKVGKTVCVLFQKDPTPKTITLNVDGTEIHSLKEVKFLGMWLDNHLNWSNHIEKLIIKISRNSNLIKYNKNTMPSGHQITNPPLPCTEPHPIWTDTMGKQCFVYTNKQNTKNPE